MLSKVVIVFVGTYPKPSNGVAFPLTDCAVTSTNTHGIDWLLGVNALKVKARVMGIRLEEVICGFCLVLNIAR